jgi:DnaK suppressor protein
MSNSARRHAELKLMLMARRRALSDDVQSRIRHGRDGRTQGVRDDLEHSDEDFQGDIELTLIQMHADTLARIDEALARLDAGTYGLCFDCECEISESRLRALPFAVRCQACEERREREEQRPRPLGGYRRGFLLLSDDLAGR